jgi:hypothetical protein
MSVIRERALAELAHRVALFPHEIDRLEAAVMADEGGSGIHASQVSVLKILMAELLRRQRDFLERLGHEAPDAEFADGIEALVFEEMAGAQKVWNIFSHAFAARRRSDLTAFLDTADLVAAECYLLCISRARNWGVLDADSLREPPLVCPEASPGPITLGRQELLGNLCDAGWRFHDLRLPIPLVLLPIDQIECVWLLPALCHEVGHDVDKDLGLTAELQQVLADSARIAPERKATWQRWVSEILADALGVLLGNVGFADSLSSMLLVLAPGSRYLVLDTTVPHPHPLVRIPLIAAMLRRLGVPALAEAAVALESSVRSFPMLEGLAPFQGEIDVVASALLESKLRALGGHALVELNPEVAVDVKKERLLADFLASGELRPSPDRPSRFPYRLVPVAAQLAVVETSPKGEQLDAVQRRATEFVAAIPRPPMLGGPPRLTPKRAAFLAQLVRQIQLGAGS